MYRSQCKNCCSYAINPGKHGRDATSDLDLCDICYWRKRAEATQMKFSKCYAYRVDRASGKRWYVAQLPGDGGVDWGWTTKVKDTLDKPIKLDLRWVLQFIEAMRAVGYDACVTDVLA